jgi:hypothetical protein
MTHIANSRLAGLVHAVGCMTTSRVYPGSSNNSSNRNSRSSSNKGDLHLPRVARSRVGKVIHLQWVITSHILKTSSMARRTTMRTVFLNHLSNTPSSHLALAPHQALRALQASSLSHMAKARVRACMASSISKPMTNRNWVITRMRTATRTS